MSVQQEATARVETRVEARAEARVEAGVEARGPGVPLAMLMRTERERRGLSLAQLASRVGCAKSYLSALENDLRGTPSDALLVRLEQALELPSGALMGAGRWRRSLEVGGPSVRRDVEALTDTREAARKLAHLLRQSERGRSLDDAYASGALRQLVDQIAPEEQSPQLLPIAMGRNVPLINKVAAGYPTEFTDLSYPARVADEYVRCPEVTDPDAFAARVVGDSMEPAYAQGDVVVFSPARPVVDGSDCFARLEPDHQSTFKRIYFEGDSIRLQPLNSAYPPRTLHREQVAGLYAAVAVIKRI